MPLSFWLTVRQARDRVRDGRLDAAAALVAPLADQGYKRATRLQRDIAAAHLTRAEKTLDAGDPDAAWADLLAAESLVPDAPRAGAVRARLVPAGLAECQAALGRGRPDSAADLADRLRGRRVRHPLLTDLADAAAAWLAAATAADRGQPVRADELARVAARLGPPAGPALADAVARLTDREARVAAGLPPLAAAAGAQDWVEVVRLADAVLGAAPHHADVRALRAKAWAALHPATTGHKETTYFHRALSHAGSSAGAPGSSAGGSSRGDGPPGLPRRFLLWVDGVGGYLVCLTARVTVGQAAGDTGADVPVFAELARVHAEIARDADGGYVFESARGAAVNGRPVTRAVLAAGDRITLGTACQFVFRKPVGISATARLDVVSGHRLPWAVDGVLLMDQTVTLGPTSQSHLCWPDGDGPAVILYRTAAGLALKCPGRFRVADQVCQDRADVPVPAVVCGDGFAFALDPVGGRGGTG